MEDVIARGMISGLILGIIGAIGSLIWWILRSQSEGARRFKIVGGITLLLLLGSMLVAMMGVFWAIVVGIAIAAIVWVVKGFKSPGGPTGTYSTASSRTTFSREADATEFSEVKEAVAKIKTVIVCPSCGGKLRVDARKYIDVTCPHCTTVFRTHT